VANDDDVLNLQVAGLKIPDESAVKINNINDISRFMDYSLIEVKYKKDIPKDALKIAKMAGIPKEILDEAEKYLEQ
jgi:DNA mismatch repair ATPase MutS